MAHFERAFHALQHVAAGDAEEAQEAPMLGQAVLAGGFAELAPPERAGHFRGANGSQGHMAFVRMGKVASSSG